MVLILVKLPTLTLSSATPVDTLTRQERSERMARVRGKDTRPEMALRRALHRLGYRYRLHSRTLPGRPDLVFPGRRKVIFVHGCFWHRHCGCKLARLPKSRPEFWVPKLEGNALRDARNLRAVTEMGWDAFVLWECEVARIGNHLDRITTFLGPIR